MTSRRGPRRRAAVLSAAAAGALACLGLSPRRSRVDVGSELSPSSPEGRSLRMTDLTSFMDPKSINLKTTDKDFARLDDLKLAPPSLVVRRPENGDSGWVVDVASIGSDTRFDYIEAQAETWASSARNFWGFTERQDFDPNCPSMDDAALVSFIRTCRAPNLGTAKFGIGHGGQAGWFCAQRRPGRALGWLQGAYRKEEAPDALLLVDDDTSVDIAKVKEIILQANRNKEGAPFVGAGSVLSLGKFGGFSAAHGGFGTFFNKAAIETLTRPIYCDERQGGDAHSQRVCAKIRDNVVGEADVFRHGDSAFDIFYKVASRRLFCMHSDWEMGYMIKHYSGATLEQVKPGSRKGYCADESVACHYQSPRSMEEFATAHPQR